MRRQAESATGAPTVIASAPRLAPTEATRRWATLLQQIFEVDPLACPTRHGPVRVVAFITQASVIDQILTHLRTRASRGPSDRAPPASPPPGTAVRPAHEARERGGEHAAARRSVLAAVGDHAVYSTDPNRNSYPANRNSYRAVINKGRSNVNNL